MSGAKYTPGPWKVWEPETETGHGDEKAKTIIIGRERKDDVTQEIAYVNCESFYFKGEGRVPVPSGLLRETYWPTAPAEAFENAKLIASAPRLAAQVAKQREIIARLVAAAERAVTLYDLIIDDWGTKIDPDGDLPPERAELKIALAKAGGRRP